MSEAILNLEVIQDNTTRSRCDWQSLARTIVGWALRFSPRRHTVTFAPNLPTIRYVVYFDSDNKFKVTIWFREAVYVIYALN